MRTQVAAWSRAHPALAGSLVGCVSLGVFAAFSLLPPEWSGLRRGAAGCIGGTGVWLLIVAPRLVG